HKSERGRIGLGEDIQPGGILRRDESNGQLRQQQPDHQAEQGGGEAQAQTNLAAASPVGGRWLGHSAGKRLGHSHGGISYPWVDLPRDTPPARRASLAEIAALGDWGFRRRQTGLSEEVGLGFELAEGLEAKLGVGGEELVDGLAAALEGIVIIELHESAGSEVWIPARKAKLRGLIEIAVDVCECDLGDVGERKGVAEPAAMEDDARRVDPHLAHDARDPAGTADDLADPLS